MNGFPASPSESYLNVDGILAYGEYEYEFSLDSTRNQWIIFSSRIHVTSFLVYIPQHILHFHDFVHLGYDVHLPYSVSPFIMPLILS
jgi:hypothetical protein